MKKAVVLLSGGLDSATALAIAKDSGFVSFNYDQRHKVELQFASKLSQELGAASHQVVEFSTFGGSALNDPNIAVPKGRSMDEMTDGIPVTYVPARNTIFLSFGLSYAEVLDADAIYTGVNALDYSGYPDCRLEYIRAYQDLIRVATKKTVEGGDIAIFAPLIKLTKKEIVEWGTRLGVDYSITSSCYDPDERGHACGKCDSCLIRKAAFEEAGIPDPTIYQR